MEVKWSGWLVESAAVRAVSNGECTCLLAFQLLTQDGSLGI